ncbi:MULTISPECIES: helix-turn-helix domain-containing protein [Sphingobacterium]|uniref:helix-turn-helix domain-containing protein n=1 Tax=Sphingobacterium TaxID=28453 RepID=UPI0014052E4C|nr:MULTISPECIES: helix-turn-helix transcriptional regulator [Sphingobacterium]MCW2262546.1 transcriptional regulator with XRE-family HTH domain [Sphingobacterium kitahiroshimense]NJI74561.1 helix-turn-helix transcriptional regulator [Sphingobacterium sp. B16(2022)]
MERQNIQEQIKFMRKQRGLTQQDLAEVAGVSLRTIQRVEKGTEEISGFSLKQISQVLEIPLEQLIMPNVNQISIDKDQTGSIKGLYLSSLLLFVNPLLGLLVPAIIGSTKQNKSDFYKKELRKMITAHALALFFLSISISYLFLTGLLNITMPAFLDKILNAYVLFTIPLIYYVFIILFTAINYLNIDKKLKNQDLTVI